MSKYYKPEYATADRAAMDRWSVKMMYNLTDEQYEAVKKLAQADPFRSAEQIARQLYGNTVLKEQEGDSWHGNK